MLTMAFDVAKVHEAVRAGLTADIMAELRDYGIVYDSRLGTISLLDRPAKQIRIREVSDKLGNTSLACDQQPELVTVNNAGIPAYLTNFIDPTVIKIAVSPMRATEIVGSEQKKGDWTTTHATFMTVEHTGETSAYGDFNNNGSSGANLNFPTRQSFHYQTFTNWGELELARAALARVDYANQINLASILVLNKYQNASYFLGVAGIANYGLLNDPALPPPIVASVVWNASATTGEQVYEDIRRLFVQLQWQSNGVINNEQSMTLALSNTLAPALNKTNEFNVNVWDQLKKNYPNLTVKQAVEYETASGQLIQLICNQVDAQQTATTAYTEKVRAHAVVVASSSWSQKKSQGTFGTVIYNPFAIASMIGA